MKKIHLWSALAILLLFAGNAFADPITYTETATATGTLGANSFTNALITLSVTGNTADVTEDGAIFFNNPGSDEVTLTVAGLGTSTFTDDIALFDNQNLNVAGFTDLTMDTTDILDSNDNNGAFLTYDLTTAIGPLNANPFINPGYGFSTTDGTFTIDSIDGEPTFDDGSTFTATLGTPPVPEPSSLLLLGTGLLGAAGALRRRLIA